MENGNDWNDKRFSSIIEAVRFLSDQGFKIKKSKAYQDRDKGLLRVGEDGSVSGADLKIYALTLGKSKVTSQADKEQLHEKKLRAEIRKLEADIEAKEFARKREEEKYIPREDFERELASRAAILENGLKRWIMAKAPEIVAIVGGDPKKIPLLIDRGCELIDEEVNGYATTKKYYVLNG